jgi:hypothetical protein
MHTRVIVVGNEPVEKLIQSLDQLIATRERSFRAGEYFVNLRYPDANPEMARELLITKCERNRIRYCEAPQGYDDVMAFNWVLSHILECPDDDLAVFYPGTSFPSVLNWERAVTDSIRGDTDTVWSSLLSDEVKGNLNTPANRDERTLPNGRKVWHPKQPQAVAVSAFHYGWLKSQGGLPARGTNPNQGIGQQLHAKLGSKKRSFLPDFTESNILRT